MAERLKFAFYIDDPSPMKIEKDTSFHLMKAAIELGHRIYYFEQNSLCFYESQVWADVHEVVDIEDWSSRRESSYKTLALSNMDVVFIRKDPPFDRRYFYSTLLLDFLSANTLVVNRPQSLRDWNEKLGALVEEQFAPPTFIGSHSQAALKFCRSFEKVVSKPIDGHGGRGIEILESKDITQETVNHWTKQGTHTIVLQKFVPQADFGDKRILIFRGEPLGAILRVAAKPGMLNNLDQGGHAEPVDLSERDLEVCQALAPYFVKAGLDFVGIDMLGDFLTEVNVTSPTGLQELCRFHGQAYHKKIIQYYIDSLS